MKRNIHTLLMLGAAGIVSAASGQNIPQGPDHGGRGPGGGGDRPDDVRHLLRGHQPFGRRGHVRGTDLQPGVRREEPAVGLHLQPGGQESLCPVPGGLLVARTDAQLEHSLGHRRHPSGMDDRSGGRSLVFGPHRRYGPPAGRGLEGHVSFDRRLPGSVPPRKQRVLRPGRRGGREIRPALLRQGRGRIPGKRDGGDPRSRRRGAGRKAVCPERQRSVELFRGGVEALADGERRPVRPAVRFGGLAGDRLRVALPPPHVPQPPQRTAPRRRAVRG